jgi:hypothetical protein
MGTPRIIAFYLPQFYPIPENDEWWGKGFTEWYNVGKAKPLFWGHKQPKVPTDLGYYDLRVPEVREAQAELAKNAGIEGFCYWHYWFGHGKQLLEKPLREVIETKKPNFPFCLAWANEDWKAKTWNRDSRGDKLLIKQRYGGIKDYTQHFYTILPILKDERYIKVNNHCLFMIYRPSMFIECKLFIEIWQKLAQKNNLEKFHFVAHADSYEKEYQHYINMGFDAIYTNRMFYATAVLRRMTIATILKYSITRVLGLPRITDFKNVIRWSYDQNDCEINKYPGIISDWDHTPRSGKRGIVFINFNKSTFSQHIEKQLSLVRNKPDEESLIFLKSWNEWGEGNFMEPDLQYKTMKTEVLRENLAKYNVR